MNKFKKELISRGIIYENNDTYEEGKSFIALEGNYIITLWGCNVLPSELHVFDRNFKPVGSQLLFPERKLLSKGMTWESRIFDSLVF